jgi:hypothetical protein
MWDREMLGPPGKQETFDAAIVLLRSVELARWYNCCAFLESNAESLINRVTWNTALRLDRVNAGTWVSKPRDLRNLCLYSHLGHVWGQRGVITFQVSTSLLLPSIMNKKACISSQSGSKDHKILTRSKCHASVSYWRTSVWRLIRLPFEIIISQWLPSLASEDIQYRNGTYL